LASEQASKDYLFQETIKLWLYRNSKRFESVSGDSKISMGSNASEIIEKFRNHLTKMQEVVESLSEKAEMEEKAESEGVSNPRNIRIAADDSI
jgi:hypothetical protein